MRYICHISWLGGWLLPQQKRYFALCLPQGWWVFGLHGNIDIFQFKYFTDIVRDHVGTGTVEPEYMQHKLVSGSPTSVKHLIVNGSAAPFSIQLMYLEASISFRMVFMRRSLCISLSKNLNNMGKHLEVPEELAV